MTVIGGNGQHRGPAHDGVVYGLQTWHGQFVMRGTHHCAKNGCQRPAIVAVFGKRTATETAFGRLNVCREHLVEGARELEQTWICALPADRKLIGEYCPHCGALARDVRGWEGHSVICPIGLSWPEACERMKVKHEIHDKASCDVCQAYIEEVPGPTG